MDSEILGPELEQDIRDNRLRELEICEYMKFSSSKIRAGSRWGILTIGVVAFAMITFDLPISEERSVIKLTGSSRIPAKHRYDAFGDSITLGNAIAFTVNEVGKPKKSANFYQGWPEILGELLSEHFGVTIEVINKGYSGDRAAISRTARLPIILRRSAKANFALLLIGTNDSNDFEPTPSGKDCLGASCDNTFKGEALKVIRVLQNSGRETVYVGLLTPAWGSSLESAYADPLDPSIATRNTRIREYNDVILEELSLLPGVRLGPDFFSCFLNEQTNRFALFEDSLHPNSLGYLFMAALWRDVIVAKPTSVRNSDCVSPIYIIESLEPYEHGHKQNILGVGDRYFTDEPHTLKNIPPEIEAGIWISQANVDKANRDADFLSFNVGDAPVSVYIAFDGAGNPPASTTHDFEATVLSEALEVSDSRVGTMSMLVARDVVGSVGIGGNQSNAQSMAQQQGYVVIVVP